MKYKTKIEVLQLKALHEFPGNAQEVPEDKMSMIKADMREHGWYAEFALVAFFDADKNIVCGESKPESATPFIVSGNHRVRCAIDVGILDSRCIVIDDPGYTWARANTDNIKYNSLHGEPDPVKLSDFIDNMLEEFDLNIEDISADIGISEEDIAQILDSNIDLNEPDEKADEVPEVKEIKSKTGDLYELNGHRVLCGDSTDAACVDRLMDGKKADMVFTDPPYGVSIGDKNKLLDTIQKADRIKENIQHDTLPPEELKKLLTKSFQNLKKYSNDVCSYFVTAPQGGELGMMMMMMMRDAGLPIKHVIIWVKNKQCFSFGRLDYEYKHEPILYTWNKKHKFYGNGKYKSSVWEIAKENKCDLHPTMKPVELIINALLNNSVDNNIVCDFFFGSGSTLIACEKTNRICHGMEIDPHYIDVIVQRYINYTGNTDNCYLIRDNEKISIRDIGFEVTQ